MVNTIVSDFSRDYLRPAILELEEEKVICVKKWILKDKDECVKHENRIWWWDIVFGEPKNDSVLSREEIDYLMSNFWLFEQHMCREKAFELETTYGIHNIVLKIAKYFKYIIEFNDVKLILFLDVPHGRYDYLLYKVAKMLKVRTLFCMSAFWNGYTYIYENLEDIGKYKKQDLDKLDIEEKFEKYLPYMQKKSNIEKLISNTKALLNTKDFFRERVETFSRNKVMYNSLKGYLFIHLQRALKRYLAKEFYESMYKKTFNEDIHNDEKFVYFPLHLQPEMTTDSLGGVYYDQLLAIECLRRVLPCDWWIYVKENPKQTYYMRDKSFFDRIKCIKNLRLIGKDVDTYTLMKKCQFVATITGTAGWEAITGGKNALVFGYAWYRYLPGVSQYYDGITIEEICNNKILHEELERKAAYLKNTAYKFVTEDYYKSIMTVSAKDNVFNLKSALIEKIITDDNALNS